MENFYSKHLIELGMVAYSSLEEVERSCRILAVMQYRDFEMRRLKKQIVIVFKDRAVMKAGIVSTDSNYQNFIKFEGWLQGGLAIDNPSRDEMTRYVRLNFFCEEY